MAGSRLVAQLFFVICVVPIFLHSMTLLKLNQYFYSPVLFLLAQHQVKPNVSNLQYYSNLSSLASLGGNAEERKIFWNDVSVTLSQMDNAQSPPITELRLNLIHASDRDQTADIPDEKTRRVMEMFAFEIEEKLLSVRPLIPRVDVRLLEFPHCQLHRAIVEADNRSHTHTPSFYLSGLKLRQAYHEQNGLDLDYLARTGLEPACVGACKQVFIAIYSPKRQHQPMHISHPTTTRPQNSSSAGSPLLDSEEEAADALVLNKQLAVMVLNDDDVSSSSTVHRVTTVILSKLIKPFLFGSQSMDVNLGELFPVSSIPKLLISRVIHLQRNCAVVLGHISSLELNSEYYLHLQHNHPMFDTLVNAVEARDRAVACLDGAYDDIGEDSSGGMERLQCAHHHLLLASTLLQRFFNSPDVLSEVRENYEYLLALTVPYWFPILIPVVYGTYIEIQRYKDKA